MPTFLAEAAFTWSDSDQATGHPLIRKAQELGLGSAGSCWDFAEVWSRSTKPALGPLSQQQLALVARISVQLNRPASKAGLCTDAYTLADAHCDAHIAAWL